MFLAKIFLDHMRLTLTVTQVTSSIFNQLLLIFGATSSHSIALYILVKQLVRIKFRAVAGQKE
ncbi:MAG: hypothetical protein OS130_10640 [Thermodesulfobacteriota bacterium]|jgi:hypothetical protein|nr:MAG: hypothetical protein OS130_10640 [Thermodesulfobacteriota bacterium]